jgi:NADPH-dependent curcumin reductase CurA
MNNRRVLLASHPTGWVSEGDFRIEDAPLPKPADGEVLVKNLWLSLDPYMRGRISTAKSYVKGVSIGEVMVGQTVGEVVESRHPKLKPGDKVLTQLGWQIYGATKEAIKVEEGKAPLSYYLGLLGMPGMTAYFGLLEIGKPREGETVVVSGAAGAVGSVVGQVAKIKGCRAVGIAGGEEKCRHVVEELGFDAAIDYKSENVIKALRQHCPDGIDVYFDNVGGDILDAALACLARGARIPLCGAISQYNAEGGMRGPSNYMSLLVNRATMTGFLVFDFADRYAHAAQEMAGWMQEGRLRSFEDVAGGGVAKFPETLLRLFRGENLGKLVLEV